MKKKFDFYTFMKVDVDPNTVKLYHFRYNKNDMDYECEEFIYKNKQVLDLKYGESSREYFDQILNDPKQKGISPVIYFECKGVGWKAFGEQISIEEMK